jgi:hypothetical protein
LSRKGNPPSLFCLVLSFASFAPLRENISLLNDFHVGVLTLAEKQFILFLSSFSQINLTALQDAEMYLTLIL